MCTQSLKLFLTRLVFYEQDNTVYASAAGLISSFLSEQESVVVTNSNLREMCDNIIRQVYETY